MNQTNYSAYLKYENEQERKYQETLKEFGFLRILKLKEDLKFI